MAKHLPKRRHTRYRTDKERLKAMYDYVTVCLRAIEDIIDSKSQTSTYGRIADMMGCAPTTAANLYEKRTKWPRFDTIQKLADAAGYQFDLNDLTLSVISKPAARKQRRAG